MRVRQTFTLLVKTVGQYPAVRCKSCGNEFESQIKIDPAIYAMAPNLRVGKNTFTCPHCNAQADYSERDFVYTKAQAVELASFGKIVQAFVDHVQSSDKPLKAASDLLEELAKAKTKNDVKDLQRSSNLNKIRKWLPDSPEKIAAYIAIASVIVQLLTKEPNVKIEYNTVINQINQTVVVQRPGNEAKTPVNRESPKVGRNESCPCGSGKKYKHCHGRLP